MDVGKELGLHRHLPRLRIELGKGRAPGSASAVDQNVQRPTAQFHRLDHGGRGCGIGQVDRKAGHFCAGGATQFLAGFVQVGL